MLNLYQTYGQSLCICLENLAGFGQDGSEFSQMAGHDSNYIALSGLTWAKTHLLLPQAIVES